MRPAVALAVFAISAACAAFGAAHSKMARKPATTFELPAGNPVASRIGAVYGPSGDNSSRENVVDILTDFVLPSREPAGKPNLNEIRSNATLTCSDCENPKEQSPTQVRHFSDTGEGMTMVIAVETGSAMSGSRLASIKQGLLSILEHRHPKDRFALVTVGSDLRVLSDFSATDQGQRQAVGNLRTEPVAYPRLYRALTKALDLFDQANKGFPQRRRMLIVSTGRNEASAEQSTAGGFRDDDVIARANQANVIIDAIGVPVPLPPRTISLIPPEAAAIDPQIQQQIGRPRLEIPVEQSIDTYLDALEKMVRATGGIYLRQDPANSSIADKMGEGVQWLNDTPVLAFDLSRTIPSDGKNHHVALRLASQPGREFEAVITMPQAHSWFRLSPGLVLFIFALLVLMGLLLVRGGKKPAVYLPPVSPSQDSEIPAQETYLQEPREADQRSRMKGETVREGLGNPRSTITGGRDLIRPSIAGHRSDAPSGLLRYGPPASSRSATRVMTSWFPAPTPGSPCCVLRVVSGSCAGMELAMEFSEVTIGREQEMNTLVLPDPAASSHHATFRWNAGVVTVTDDNSTNGTTVGGARIAPARPHPLQVGDQIQIGSNLITVELPQPARRM